MKLGGSLHGPPDDVSLLIEIFDERNKFVEPIYIVRIENDPQACSYIPEVPGTLDAGQSGGSF